VGATVPDGSRLVSFSMHVSESHAPSRTNFQMNERTIQSGRRPGPRSQPLKGCFPNFTARGMVGWLGSPPLKFGWWLRAGRKSAGAARPGAGGSVNAQVLHKPSARELVGAISAVHLCRPWCPK